MRRQPSLSEQLIGLCVAVSRYVTISSLVFSMDSQFLCASSNTETVHIFKLEHLTDRQVRHQTQGSHQAEGTGPRYPVGMGTPLGKLGLAAVLLSM